MRVRRLGLADALCIGGFVAQSTWGFVATLLIPSLVGTHPVLLELFTASTPSMVAAGAFISVGRAAWITALTAPAVVWVPLDALGWWVGRRYGRRAVDVIAGGRPRTAAVVDRVDQLTGRYGALAVVFVPWSPVPNQLVYAATGWAGMPLRAFLFWDLVGSLARAAVVVALGYGLGSDAVSAATTISHYALLGVAALAVGVGAVVVLRYRRLRALGAAAAPAASPNRPDGDSAPPATAVTTPCAQVAFDQSFPGGPGPSTRRCWSP